MSKYLISTTETYRIDNEQEAANFIQEAKESNTYILGKYASEHKERKSKGEVIDEYWKVTLIKQFNDIKDPYSDVHIIYNGTNETEYSYGENNVTPLYANSNGSSLGEIE